MLDTVWEGVRFRSLLDAVQPNPEAPHVVIHCEGGYTTNLPLITLMGDNVLLAYRYADVALAPQHGFPPRLLLPSRYLWKSAKWVRGVEFVLVDRPGFWEIRGYHNNGDPWREERYSRQ
jgi:DMSO/TMAO reductase YedYZ molybdopterin-dependent catalytic subunit